MSNLNKISISYGDKIILHKNDNPCVTSVVYVDKKFFGLAQISSIQEGESKKTRNGIILKHDTGYIRVKIKFHTPKTLKNLGDYCVITKTIGTNDLKNIFTFPLNDIFEVGENVGITIDQMFFNLKIIISEEQIEGFESSEIIFLDKKLTLNASIVSKK